MFSVDLNLLYALLFVLAPIIVDVILGISLSLKDGSFDLGKLPHFLESTILPYYISLASLVFLAQIKGIHNWVQLLLPGRRLSYMYRSLSGWILPAKLRSYPVLKFQPDKPVAVADMGFLPPETGPILMNFLFLFNFVLRY